MQNPLYPIFLKLHQLEMLIVGGGEVGYEKLFFILKSSPNANITLVAPEVNEGIETLLAKGNYNVTIHRKLFHPVDVKGKQLVIAATDSWITNLEVQCIAKEEGALVNVADTPDLCDFYLGSIVTRGDLKVAISTNGKSPTFAKRFRQVLEEILPNDTGYLLNNLKVIRDKLRGNFQYKVKKLNELTSSLVEN